ncbi:winged helix-turn-helix domain-containing protein [Deinococcus sp. HMF7620]|uniref:Winged helix-turn-helix domain-containing protein n=1 Tax=Deinococcus arboris TaxID=2682977 RepID=A0A7C9HQ79_9DEIO|nr:crosslink repair DNA glycosylase YcaQ family protein [Deinococcus arboris]MVN85952.1 winged helix-turn-helix domain-containing protein [Deinococcus arboris]
MTPTLATLRAAALATLAPQPDVQTALNHMGFVQADPIRAPARAQDLTLMARVPGYRAGDLERLYPTLDIEEDMLPNYGFMPRRLQALLHPREVVTRVMQAHPGLVEEVRALVLAGEEQTEWHPREVAARLGQGATVNAWGGQSSATTRALETLHRQGEVRVVRRDGGVRVYGPAPHLAALRHSPLPESERLHGAVQLLAALYGPLPEASLSYLVNLSHFGFPHLHGALKGAFRQAVKEDLGRGQIDGVRYVWPAGLSLDGPAPSGVRIVGPFDPLVWDRRRFTHLQGWTYRFEAYTPAPKRVMGYYALPVFQAERAVGWANLQVKGETLQAEVGLVPGVRRTATFVRGLTRELERYRTFLGAQQVETL